MPPPEHMTVLLVSDQAEEIKRITMCLRSFYPGCRVEAVYSEEESLEWAAKEQWHVLLVDERLPPRMALESLAELRRRAPAAAIMVLTESVEPSLSMQVVRGGADCALFRKSPGFLSELMVMIREVLEKRELRLQQELAEARYLRLLELLPEVVYELDVEGRFVFVSQNVSSILGYSPDELIGVQYSALLLPADREVAARRFDERRTGARATMSVPLRFLLKTTGPSSQQVATMEVSAKGLYDRRSNFVGTIGVVLPIPHSRGAKIPPAMHEDVTPAEANTPVGEPLATFATELGLQPQDARTDPERLVEIVHALRQIRESLTDGQTPPAMEPITPAPPPGERRKSPRFDLPIEVKLTHEGRTWSGLVSNLGLGGVAIEFDGIVPVQANQSIRLGLASTIAVLQLKGVIQRISDVDRRRVGPRVFPGTGVVVHFSDMGREERMVLGSLLEGIRDRSISASLTVLLHPAEEEDILVEATAELVGPTPRVPLEPFPPESEEHAQAEYRLGTRVNFVMTAHIQPAHMLAERQSVEARTLNLSLTGACLRLQTEHDLEGRRLLIEFSIPPATPGLRDPQSDEPVACCVVGETAWILPDQISAAARSSVPTYRVGVRFLHLHEPGEHHIRNIVNGLLTYPLRIHGADSTAKLLSTFIACRNHRGQPLAVFYDRPRKALPPGAPLVVIAPDYGETKRDYVFLAYALACNGFHVLRVDYTDHVGESHGEMVRSTLSSMQRDLTALLEFAANSWPASPLVLIAAGLAGRVALKASAHDVKPRLLILLSSVLDVRSALQAAHGEDVVGAHLTQARTGVANILGFNVDGGRWLGDLIKENFMDLASTVRDAQRVTTPTILFAGEQDSRTPFAAVKEVEAALGPQARQTYLLPDPIHQLHQDPKKDRALYRQVVVDCLEQCYPVMPQEGPQPPSLREIDRQRLLELDRLLASRSQARLQPLDLLAPTLEPDRTVTEFGDYWRLLDDVYRLMGQLEGAERILDAVCGSGHFAKVLFINQAYRSLHIPPSGSRLPMYVGIDPDPRTIAHHAANQSILASDPHRHLEGNAPFTHFLRFLSGVVDPTKPLPFKERAFDRIVCNFALNALFDPLATIRELIRILAPGGKLVLTSLKPHADFTRLYRNIATQAQQEQALSTAKRLLSSWGTIMEAERNGNLRFFHRQELSNLLKSSGAAKPRVYPTLANQAYVAVAEKPD